MTARGGQVSRHAGPDPDTWVDLLVDEGFDRWSRSRSARPSRRATCGSTSTTEWSLGAGSASPSAIGFPAKVPVRPPPSPRSNGSRRASRRPAPTPTSAPASGAGIGADARDRHWRGIRLGAAVACALAQSRTTRCRSRQDLARRARPRTRRGARAEPAVLRGPSQQPGRVRHCAHCGRSLLDGTARLVERPQPTLGLLLLDDGSSYTLDTGYLIGCLPDLAISLSRGEVRPLVLPERDGVSCDSRRGRARRLGRHRG